MFVLAFAASAGAAQAADPPAAQAVPARPASALQDENLIVPLPAGFKVGFGTRQGQMQITEMVPAGETVQDWSSMVTEQIFYGRRNEDPKTFPTALDAGWRRACPGGSGQELKNVQENGYPVAIWMFLCPLNPATNKPESMWLKVISGADSLYSVQYAYRAAPTREMIPPTMAYLRQVLVCDTRAAPHPCPAGM